MSLNINYAMDWEQPGDAVSRSKARPTFRQLPCVQHVPEVLPPRRVPPRAPRLVRPIEAVAAAEARRVVKPCPPWRDTAHQAQNATAHTADTVTMAAHTAAAETAHEAATACHRTMDDRCLLQHAPQEPSEGYHTESCRTSVSTVTVPEPHTCARVTVPEPQTGPTVPEPQTGSTTIPEPQTEPQTDRPTTVPEPRTEPQAPREPTQPASIPHIWRASCGTKECANNMFFVEGGTPGVPCRVRCVVCEAVYHIGLPSE